MKRLVKYIPFGIASILTLVCVLRILASPEFLNARGETTHYIVPDTVQYGQYGLLAVLVLIVLKNQYWKYLLTVIFLAALTPYVHFYDSTFSIGAGKVELEITALALLILHIYLNKEIVDRLIDVFHSHPVEPKEHSEQLISQFKLKFSGKTNQELEKIVNEGILVSEAIEAAKQLLKEKN